MGYFVYLCLCVCVCVCFVCVCVLCVCVCGVCVHVFVREREGGKHLSRPSSAWTAFAIMVSNTLTSNVTAHTDEFLLFVGLTADQLSLDGLYISTELASAAYIHPPSTNKPACHLPFVIDARGAHESEAGSYLCIELRGPELEVPPAA